MRRFSLFILFAILSVGTWAYADVETLLAMPNRPTMEDLDRELPVGAHARNPIPLNNFESYANTIAEEAIMMIVSLEMHFPGAIYMAMGRDMAMLGDAMDAFYRANGMPGRIVRVNLSGDSFPESADSPQIKRFMQGLIDIPNLKQSPGYVLFDWTRYSYSSQSAKLIRAVYSEYKKRGGDLVEILPKFNVMTLTPKGGERNNSFEVQTESSMGYGYPYPAFVSISEPTAHVTSYALPWHDTFKKMRRQPDGVVRANPGAAPKDKTERPQILAEMWYVRRKMAQSTVLRAAKSLAREYGFKLELKRTRANAAL